MQLAGCSGRGHDWNLFLLGKQTSAASGRHFSSLAAKNREHDSHHIFKSGCWFAEIKKNPEWELRSLEQGFSLAKPRRRACFYH